MGPKPTVFGHCTGDHFINRKKKINTDEEISYDANFPGASTAIVLHDRFTGIDECYPKSSKSTEHCVEAFNHWKGPNEKVTQFYSDNALELVKAARVVNWPMPTSTPGIPQTNGLVERAVRRVKERGRKFLSQAGGVKDWSVYACPAA